MAKKQARQNFSKKNLGGQAKKPKTDAEKLKDLNLEDLEDVPLVGGLFKGLGKLVDLAEKVEKAGGKIERKGRIKGLGERKDIKGVYGFTVRTALGKKKPIIEPFGNIKKTPKGPKIMKEREPMVDVFDEKNEILVIAELPGVNEHEIKLDVEEDILILEARDKERKYKKEILLPAKVDIESKKMSFKNGILKIRFKKK